MKQKLTFQTKTGDDLIKFIKTNRERKILNFLNLETIYFFNSDKLFYQAIIKPQNINILDGMSPSVFLSIKNFKKIPRIRGPTLTRKILSDLNLANDKKHFFIIPDKKDIKKIKENFPYLTNVKSYNPPYIKENKFSKEEVEKMAKMIKAHNSEYVWMGISSPKQNILSYDLFSKTSAKYFFNVGAALDLISEKKSESPKIVRGFGLEWFYRLITDFKYSKKKVYKSLIGLKYLGKIRLE
jgi:exopolysaccharide biosynthesis WecB/TagA/CpsF family protein